MYTSESIVAVRPFTRQAEGAEIIIGDIETGVFLAVPAEAVELLDLLATGKSVGEVSAIYYRATGEVPDLEDLLSFLETKGFVGSFQQDSEAEKFQRPAAQRRYHFSHFPQRIARTIFSRTALVFECLFLSLAIAAVFYNRSLIPVPGDLVFPADRALSLTMLLVITYVSVFLHEFGHLVATRAVGVNSRMGISHRLWYLVAETDLTGLWSVSRKQRYLPMLAGIQVDIVLTCWLMLVLFARNQHLLAITPFWVYLLRAIVFTNIMRVSWEFFLFTRTDLYFVVATLFNCKNLLQDTQNYLRNQFARLLPKMRTVDQSAIPLGERRGIRVYAWLLMAGRMWAFSTLIWITIPVSFGYFGNLVTAFREGYSANPTDFVDAVVSSAYFLIPTITGFVLWGRTLIRRTEV